MDFYRRCRNVAYTCRHFGIRRQTRAAKGDHSNRKTWPLR
jgi:hypothetical protein